MLVGVRGRQSRPRISLPVERRGYAAPLASVFVRFGRPTTLQKNLTRSLAAVRAAWPPVRRRANGYLGAGLRRL